MEAMSRVWQVAALFLLWSGVSQAYCRTTTASSDNQTCVTEGLPLFWRSACVTMSLSNRVTRVAPEAQLLTATADAVNSWSSLDCAEGGSPSVKLQLAPTTVSSSTIGYVREGSNSNLIVYYDTDWPYGTRDQLALTTLTFQKSNGEIVDADLEVNATLSLTARGSVPPNGYDLATILRHEAGHVLGLAHSATAGATMFATYDPGTIVQRTQKPDDIEGICAAYLPNGTRATASGVINASACEPEPLEKGCGCASQGTRAPAEGDVAVFGLAFATLAMLRRRKNAAELA
jgi:MYXO-CTERM domain-containing protein